MPSLGPGLALTEEAVRKLRRLLNRVEHGLRLREGRPAQPQGRPIAQFSGWVQVTSLTTDGAGRYPAQTGLDTLEELDTPTIEAQGSPGDVYLRTANSGKLVLSRWYWARLEGDSLSGVPVYLVDDGDRALADALAIDVTTANTTTPVTVLTLGADSTGTPGAGFGSTVVLTLDSATVEDRTAATLTTDWTTATDATRTSEQVCSLVLAGATVEVERTTPASEKLTATTTNTSTPVTGLTLVADSTGTPSAGFGYATVVSVETATPGTFVTAAKETTTLTTATAGSETSQVVTTLVNAGSATDAMTLTPSGLTVSGAVNAGGLHASSTLTLATGTNVNIGVTGGTGYVLAYNGPATAYIPLVLDGSSVTLSQSGTPLLVAGSSTVTVSNLAVTGNASSVGFACTSVWAAGNTAPATGQVVRMLVTGGSGYVQAYDFTGGALYPLILAGSTLTLTVGSTSYIMPATDGSSGTFLKTNGSGTLSWDTPAGTGTGTPAWVKVTKSYTDFSNASMSHNFTIYTLAAKQVLHNVTFQHTAAFTGGSVATCTIGLGTVLGNVKNPFDIFQAPGNTVFPAWDPTQSGYGPQNFGTTAALTATVATSGDTMDHLTAGSIDFYLLLSTLP